MRDFLLLILIGGSFLIALRRPVFGLLAFLCFSLINPASFSWGMVGTFPHAQIIAVGTFIGHLFWSEPKRFPFRREYTFLLVLWGMFGVSTLFAIYPEAAFERLIHVSKILLIVFLSISLINNERRLHLMLRVIALSLGAYGLRGGFFAIVTGGEYMVFGPEKTFLEANNAIGLAFAMNLPLLVYLLKIETNPWLRRIIKMMVVLSYPAVVCTFSRGAWVGQTVATVLIILKSKHKLLSVAATGILLIIILPFLPQLVSQRVVNRYDDLTNYKEEASAQGRYLTWRFCKRVGLALPLHGGGFDFYSIETYAKYYPEFLALKPGKMWSCHSMWFTIFGEHGLPGFILWICLLSSCFLSMRQMRFYGRTHGEMSWIIPYANMLQVTFVAYMVVGTFLDIAYFELFYYLIAVIVIIKEIIRRAAVESYATAMVPERRAISLTSQVVRSQTG